MEVEDIASNEDKMIEVEDNRHEIEEMEINMNVKINKLEEKMSDEVFSDMFQN